jgi:hypothetical protein
MIKTQNNKKRKVLFYFFCNFWTFFWQQIETTFVYLTSTSTPALHVVTFVKKKLSKYITFWRSQISSFIHDKTHTHIQLSISSFSLSLSFSHKLSLPLSLSVSVSQYISLCLSLTQYYSLCLSLCLFHTLSPSLYFCLFIYLTLFLSFYNSNTLSISWSLSYSQLLSLFLSLSVSLTHNNSLSLSLLKVNQSEEITLSLNFRIFQTLPQTLLGGTERKFVSFSWKVKWVTFFSRVIALNRTLIIIKVSISSTF